METVGVGERERKTTCVTEKVKQLTQKGRKPDNERKNPCRWKIQSLVNSDHDLLHTKVKSWRNLASQRCSIYTSHFCCLCSGTDFIKDETLLVIMQEITTLINRPDAYHTYIQTHTHTDDTLQKRSTMLHKGATPICHALP